MRAGDGRVRVVITGVQPELDGGRFPIKRTVGEQVVVEADIFADGHDALSGVVLYRHEEDAQWSEIALRSVENDHWRGAFIVTRVGRYHYTLQAWIDRFTSWRRGLAKKIEAGQDMTVELLIGASLLEETSKRASGKDISKLKKWADVLSQLSNSPLSAHPPLTFEQEVYSLVAHYPDQRLKAIYDKELIVMVDREKACFSSWYEMFPRSCSSAPGHHGAFTDCEARLPYIAVMGFDMLYFPPIHPIGFP